MLENTKMTGAGKGFLEEASALLRGELNQAKRGGKGNFMHWKANNFLKRIQCLPATASVATELDHEGDGKKARGVSKSKVKNDYHVINCTWKVLESLERLREGMQYNHNYCR